MCKCASWQRAVVSGECQYPHSPRFASDLLVALRNSWSLKCPAFSRFAGIASQTLTHLDPGLLSACLRSVAANLLNRYGRKHKCGTKKARMMANLSPDALDETLAA